MEIGNNIRSLRSEKGLTQKGLADLLFVTAQAVSRWEKNEVEPDLDMLQKMAGIFGCTIDDILYGKSEKVAPEAETLPVIIKPVEQNAFVSAETEGTKEITPDKTIAFHCAKCDKPLSEDETMFVESNGEKTPYCFECYKQKNGEEVKESAGKVGFFQRFKSSGRELALRSYGWGIFAGVVALAITIWVAFGIHFPNQNTKWVVFALSPVVSYAFFSLVYCLCDETYIMNVFSEIFVIGFVKFPGIIFTMDIEGVGFLIIMKIIFWILGALFALAGLCLAVGVSVVLSVFTFPFMANRDGKAI